MAVAQIGLNDAVLVFSLLYLCIDLQSEWDGFAACKQPLHKWLLGSYALVVMSRLVYIAGNCLATQPEGASDFLLDLRHKDTLLKTLMSITWLVIVPAFTFWSAVGTKWIWDVRRFTPECLPSTGHLWFLVVWQVLSYMWILIHGGLGVVAWILERRIRRAEGDLRQLEDPELLARWGQVSRLSGISSLPVLQGEVGLTPSQITSLPGLSVAGKGLADVEEECPVCLCALRQGDSVRQLVGCGHTFHRSCIDLWLIRRADCPLCKRKVQPHSASGELPVARV